jgi:CRP/FNR family transcriptional regulator, cyclic AMP receptor protein
MISAQVIRCHSCFAGLDEAHITTLARSAREVSVRAGHRFFRERDELSRFYLVVEGAVAIVIAVPDREAVQPTPGPLVGDLKTRDITVSTVGTGDVFGWSALVPPHTATAGAKAATPCRVIEFDVDKLRPALEEDCPFARSLTLMVAQTIRGRLDDLHIELLADIARHGAPTRGHGVGVVSLLGHYDGAAAVPDRLFG